MLTFQELIKKLLEYWEKQGCAIHQGYDLEVGAGTFNPTTFLKSLGPEPYKAAYIEPSRRPQDGRYGDNPNRLQQHHQLQVILKPSPFNIQELYLNSLEAIGFNLKEHDIRFVHDDWESPTLGAWGLGWEVWMNGMEITQFTYFQCVGGKNLDVITGEITYGLERLAMYLQQVENVYDLKWNDKLSYGDIFKRSEFEWSHYNFEKANSKMWERHFNDYEQEGKKLIEQNFPIPAYDFIMKASHAFNMLDARGAISVTERTGYIARIRNLSQLITENYIKSRSDQGFPLLKKEEKQKFEEHKVKYEIGNPNEKEDFLLEIGSEELPSSFVEIGCRNLKELFKKLLEDNDLACDGIETFGTPRRIAIIARGIPKAKAEKVIERKGPPVKAAFDENGEHTKIGTGFLNSIGKNETEIRNIKGNDYLFAKIKTPAVASQEILANNLPKLIANIKFPKKMRWNTLDVTYARPLKWLVAIFGEDLIKFNVASIFSTKTSYGHRQICNESFEVNSPNEYVGKLREYYVLVDIEERKKTIKKQLKEIKCKVVNREKVIKQVLHLTEWPQVAVCSFDEKFLSLPRELLISEMVEHQKYFPVENKGLKNQFVITSDNHINKNIKDGNEKVLSARLNDGAFLYEQDLKSSLENFNEKLKKMTFQESLGSVFDKKERIANIAETLNKELKLNLDVKKAAVLCKADLASELVDEFPELQGIAGKYYALAAGESEDVALAIEEHWMPRSENGELPSSDLGAVISMADKIDNFICLFSAGKKPTSSSDPYALRRQAIGMIKTIIKHKYKFNIKDIFEKCCKEKKVAQEIVEFIVNRIRVVFQDYGFAPDEINASLETGIKDIFDSFGKTEALHRFRNEKRELFLSLFEVFKRAKGQIEGEKKHSLDKSLVKEKEEKELFQKLLEIEKPFIESLDSSNYDKSYELVASLQKPLANLFDNVKILADDENLRKNRIALLQKVFALFDKLLDFGIIAK